MKKLISIFLIATIFILGACCIGLHIKAKNFEQIAEDRKIECNKLKEKNEDLLKFKWGNSYEEVYATYEGSNKDGPLVWKLENGTVFTSWYLPKSSLCTKISFMEKGLEYRLIIIKNTDEGNDVVNYWIIDMVEIAN